MDDKEQEYRLKFLQKRHEEMTSKDAKHDELVLKATSGRIVSKERIIRGEANEVYLIKVDSGGEYILRISHGSSYSFSSEKWVIGECQKSGVPVPEIVYVEDYEEGGEKYSACVMERLQGKSVDELKRENQWTIQEVRPILVRAGKTLARLHEIATKKFGQVNQEGVGRFDTWYEFLSRHKIKSENHKRILEARGLDPKIVDLVYEVIESHKQVLESTEPHLLHGDFGYDHIFVRDGEITGIIDFGSAKSGDPVYDLAWWDFFHQDKESLRALEEGYKEIGKLGENYELKRHLYKLYLCLQLLGYYDDTQNEQGMKIVEREIRSGIEYFKD